MRKREERDGGRGRGRREGGREEEEEDRRQGGRGLFPHHWPSPEVPDPLQDDLSVSTDTLAGQELPQSLQVIQLALQLRQTLLVLLNTREQRERYCIVYMYMHNVHSCTHATL